MNQGTPNKAGTGNGARTLLFHVERLGRAVPDLIRYAEGVPQPFPEIYRG